MRPLKGPVHLCSVYALCRSVCVYVTLWSFTCACACACEPALHLRAPRNQIFCGLTVEPWIRGTFTVYTALPLYTAGHQEHVCHGGPSGAGGEPCSPALTRRFSHVPRATMECPAFVSPYQWNNQDTQPRPP